MQVSIFFSAQYFLFCRDMLFLFQMDDEKSVNNENNVDVTTPTEKKYLIEFIQT